MRSVLKSLEGFSRKQPAHIDKIFVYYHYKYTYNKWVIKYSFLNTVFICIIIS